MAELGLGPAWAAKIEDLRRRKDEWLRSGEGFLPPEALAGFTGLSYFPPDPAWVFSLPAAPPASFPPEVELGMSSGASRWWAAFSQVNLPVPGQGTFILTLFTPLGEEKPESAFLPFWDETCGSGPGRYLDVPLRWAGEGLTAELDFNRAYQPSCVFAPGYSCPLPPAAHRFPFAIPAGERP